MKYCKFESCEHCLYSAWTGMFMCDISEEEVFDDTECEFGEE